MDIKWIVLVAVALLLGAFLAFGPGQGPQSKLVIAEGAANQIAMINGSSGQLTAIPAGPEVHGVGVLPDGKIAYAASNDNSEVSVIDLGTRKTIAQIDVGGKGHHITVCPHGKHVFVTVGSANSVAVIDPSTNMVIARIPVGDTPSYAILTPDETKLYVTNMGSNTVSVIDTAQLKVIATVNAGQSPDHAAATADSRYVYVTNGGSDSVSVIDTSSQKVIMIVAVGKGPHGIAVAERQGRSLIYVGNRGATTLSVIDPATNQVVRTVELGTNPEHITASPDGKYLYIGSNADKSILIFDTATDRVTKKIKVNSEIHQIALLGAPAAHQHEAAAPEQPARTLTEADLTRTRKAASIEINVVFMNPLLKSQTDSEQLQFKIALDTHSGDLMQYDLTKQAILRTSAGMIVDSGFIWERGSESSHHRSGVLTLAVDLNPSPIPTKSGDYLELELRDIGAPSRTFRWTQQEISDEPLSEAELILQQVHHEIIPAEGSPTPYGVTFSEAGYQTLVAKNKELPVPKGRVVAFENLDLSLPCCAFKTPSTDESKNCACEHHQALYGLAKTLLNQNYDRAQVQKEIGRWHHYLYPKESLGAEMERRGQTDPKIKAALEELKAKGKC